MFYKDSSQIYRVPELDRFEWLVHGFGTRHADVPALFPNLALLKQIHSSDCVAALGRPLDFGPLRLSLPHRAQLN